MSSRNRIFTLAVSCVCLAGCDQGNRQSAAEAVPVVLEPGQVIPDRRPGEFKGVIGESTSKTERPRSR
jgi:hypothetical protein